MKRLLLFVLLSLVLVNGYYQWNPQKIRLWTTLSSSSAVSRRIPDLNEAERHWNASFDENNRIKSSISELHEAKKKKSGVNIALRRTKYDPTKSRLRTNSIIASTTATSKYRHPYFADMANVGNLVRQGSTSKAMQVFQTVIDTHPKIHLRDCNMVLRELGDQGRLDLCEELMDLMKSKLNMRLSIVTYCTLISRAAKWKKVDVAEKYFNAMISDGIRPDSQAYNSLINAYAKIGDTTKALETMHTMDVASSDSGESSSNCKPNVVTFNTLIDSCARSGNVTTAQSIFAMMKQRRITPNARSYSCLIHTCCQAGHLDAAFKLFAFMDRENLTPTSVTYSLLLHALGKAKLLDRAFELLGTMKAKGIKPNVVTISSLVHACGRAGRLDQAFELYEQMRNSPHPEELPNSVTCSSLVDLCLKTGQVDRAFGVIRYMRDQRLALNHVTYTSLITELSYLGQLHRIVEVVMEQPPEQGEPPAAATMQVAAAAAVAPFSAPRYHKAVFPVSAKTITWSPPVQRHLQHDDTSSASDIKQQSNQQPTVDQANDDTVNSDDDKNNNNANIASSLLLTHAEYDDLVSNEAAVATAVKGRRDAPKQKNPAAAAPSSAEASTTGAGASGGHRSLFRSSAGVDSSSTSSRSISSVDIPQKLILDLPLLSRPVLEDLTILLQAATQVEEALAVMDGYRPFSAPAPPARDGDVARSLDTDSRGGVARMQSWEVDESDILFVVAAMESARLLLDSVAATAKEVRAQCSPSSNPAVPVPEVQVDEDGGGKSVVEVVESADAFAKYEDQLVVLHKALNDAQQLVSSFPAFQRGLQQQQQQQQGTAPTVDQEAGERLLPVVNEQEELHDVSVLNEFESMKARGIEPGVGLYNTLMKSVAVTKGSYPKQKEDNDDRLRKVFHQNNLFRLYLVFQEMKAAGVEPDSAVYNTLINACADSGDLEKALETMEAMQMQGLEPDVITYTSLIKACAIAGGTSPRTEESVRMAEEIFASMQQRTNHFSVYVDPNERAYERMMHVLSRRMRYICSNDGVASSSSSSSSSTGTTSEASQLASRILTLYNEMRQRQLQPTQRIYQFTMRALSVLNDVPRCLALLAAIRREARSGGVVPWVPSSSSGLRVSGGLKSSGSSVGVSGGYDKRCWQLAVDVCEQNGAAQLVDVLKQEMRAWAEYKNHRSRLPPVIDRNGFYSAPRGASHSHGRS